MNQIQGVPSHVPTKQDNSPLISLGAVEQAQQQLVKTYTDDDIIRNIPHDAPRRGQVAAIRFALDAWNSGKRFVILEAPVGAGKSAMGLALAAFHQHSFYLTIQKMLQSQIIKDYERTNMVELKGRNAYPCTFYDLHAQTLINRKALSLKEVTKTLQSNCRPDCSTGYCKKYLDKTKCQQCFPSKNADAEELDFFQRRYDVTYSTCPYYEQVERAVNSPKVLMNFSSFLFQTQYTRRFGSRELLIVDEAHHCEPQLMDFVSLTISDLPFRKHGISLPDYDDPEAYALWFHENGIEAEIGRLVKQAKDDNNQKDEDEATRLYYKYTRFMKCVADGMTDWVCEYKVHTINNNDRFATVTLKPVFIHHFTEDLLFKYGQRILLMSATILDAGVMAKCLNIDRDDIAFFRMGNYFPKENRPIYIQGAAKMTGGKDGMVSWSGPMVKKVDEIVAKYPNERGIIHTHNFAISELLMERCRTKDRFLFQRNFRDKEQMLVEHKQRPNGVIVAPAMHEGLDLKDDLSRFQIIAKVPYPNFFDDKQLARRVDLDRRYLIWLVAIKLVQSYGRSVRSDDDWAHTYIIDSAIDRFLSEAHKMLPTWFTEAIIKEK